MNILSIIGSLDAGTNTVTSVDRLHYSMDNALSLLQTPTSFWVIILLGIALSPWMVRRQAATTTRQRISIYGAAAVIFLTTLLLFLRLRQQFISICADLLGSPEWFLIFPFQLGASSTGAILLVLAWYYVHPMAWLRQSVTVERMLILKSFTPMLLTIFVLGFMTVINFFMLLL